MQHCLTRLLFLLPFIRLDVVVVVASYRGHQKPTRPAYSKKISLHTFIFSIPAYNKKASIRWQDSEPPISGVT